MTQLPPGWATTTLGEIAETSLGKMLDRGKAIGKHLVPYLRNINVQWGSIDTSDVLTMDIPPDQQEFFRLRAGDLLICEGGEVGRCAIWRHDSGYMAFQKALHRVRPVHGVSARYLRYYIEYLHQTGSLSSYATGSTIKHIPQNQLRRIYVRLPPTAEQRRIVDALDDHLSRLDAAASGIHRVIRRASRLRERLLHLAVTGGLVSRRVGRAVDWLEEIHTMRNQLVRKRQVAAPPSKIPGYSLPDNWSVASLDSISYANSYGTSTKCNYGAAGAAVLRIPNIQQGEVDLNDLKSAADSSLDLSSLYLSAGDVLFIRTNGSRSLIGRMAVVRANMEIAFASYLIRFRLVPGGVPADWVRIVVSSPLWRGYLEGQSASSAGQYNLSTRVLAPLMIPIPPPDELSEIMKELERTETITNFLERSSKSALRRCVALRQTLLSTAFEGRLVPQDQGNEPAAVLLERIRRKRAAQPKARRGRRTAGVPQEEALL